MVAFFLIGAALGAVTGIPIGPVNIAVIDAAYRHTFMRAIGVAVGGAGADMVFAYLGLVWVGPFIQSNPIVPPILWLLSGIALLAYGVVTVRAQQMEAGSAQSSNDPNKGRFFGGVVLGAVLILLNPAALVTWTVIVGSLPKMVGITAQEGTFAAIGVGVGSFMWFSLVAWLANHGKNTLGPKMLIITRIVGLLLIGYGLFLLGKGIWVITHL